MIATAFAAAIALIHIAIVILEMVLWTKPLGRRVFGTSPEFAEQTRVLAANQGLYNAFLVAGLCWGLLRGAGSDIAIFFLACVLIAGLFGAATASRTILYVQAVPAALALAAIAAGI